MAKKKNRSKFPKRIAGVRIPKSFRRFANSPVGGNLVAASILYGAYSIASSDAAKSLMIRIREEVARADDAMRRFADERKMRRAKYGDDDFRDEGYRALAN